MAMNVLFSIERSRARGTVTAAHRRWRRRVLPRSKVRRARCG